MPSMVEAGCAGTNSESSTTVVVPRSVSSSALLPLGMPPRKMQFRKVMFAPVTLTYPWKSFPVMTVPLLANVWSPLTTIRAVPGTTPVLPGPGLPVRGPTGPVDGRPDGRLPDGLGDGLADALGAADPPFRPDGESVTDGGLAQDAAGLVAAPQPPTGRSRTAPARAIAHGLTDLGIIVPLAHGGAVVGHPPTILEPQQAP